MLSRIGVFSLLAASSWTLLALAGVASAKNWRRVSRSELCVTEGKIEVLASGRLRIEDTKTRAVTAWQTGDEAELAFTYLGPSREISKLSSGGMRRQIGLKLRAQDSCNVIYAMWRFEPKSELVVSIKQNPGMHSHAECGAAGYTNLKPRKELAAPSIGSSHTLRARLQDGEMSVFVDGSAVWNGSLESHRVSFDGPTGFRSDNGRFELDFYTDVSGSHAFPCAGDAEN